MTRDDAAFPLPAASAEVAIAGDTATMARSGAGNARFGAVTYNAPGTYTYKLSETIPTPLPEGWAYDESSYAMEVKVTDVEGRLTAEVTYSKISADGAAAQAMAAEFTNTYTAPTPPTPPPTTPTTATTPTVNAPKTGDNSPTGSYIALAVISFAGMGVGMTYLKKKKKSAE